MTVATTTGAARWGPEHLERLAVISSATTALIEPRDVVRVTPELLVWDAWPVQHVDGRTLRLADGDELWMALGAASSLEPGERHHHARIHLFLRHRDAWRHIGPAMPDGFSPGSREWAGSAVIRDESTVTLFFTATGRRGEPEVSFEQRVFSADATLAMDHEVPSLTAWRNLREAVPLDPEQYMTTRGGIGIPGKIKAFRDPSFFRDPDSGRDYLLFTASLAGSRSDYNGVIGIAGADGPNWVARPPIVSADGLNNELERPHVIVHHGLYYLFWSTQSAVFDPSGPVGPTGLYGMVSSSLLDGWTPLNATGLVLANPPAAPSQAYSWLVLSDLSVTSFVDDWGPGGQSGFGGTFAPFVRLRLSGDRATLVSS